MDRIYLITGASGHLGRHITAQLLAQGARIRVLLLPGEKAPQLQAANLDIVRGDVRDAESLRPLFAGLAGRQVVVIHAAGIIDITSNVSPRAFQVNVQGTQNMVRLALQHQVWRFIHISSVHAIPEPAAGRQITEVAHFSPEEVSGGYAKTKAEASQYVMDAIHSQGLPGVILHPSGIIGPQDAGNNNVVAVIKGYLSGRFPACPRGGYNLVDVRDVAAACLAAVDKGAVGEGYILSGHHAEFNQIFAMLRAITGQRKKRQPVVPLWMAKLAAPLLEKNALRKKEKPLVTRYSLATLASNDNFSHEKASRQLGFWPRELYTTLEDTVAWLREVGALPARKARRKRRAAAQS
ncbi:MAG: SDR family NAD(P)-dependent oxidoreductase [Oscillospiraceae bacterium]